MAGKYRAYPEYKDSGAGWLGEIPNHWNAMRIKFLSATIGTGGTPKSEQSFDADGEICWFTPGDFTSQLEITYSSKKLNSIAYATDDAKIFPSGSTLVIGIGATLGKVAICPNDFSCNQQINVVTPSDNTVPAFLTRSLSIQTEQMKQSSNASTIGIMNQEKTGSIEIAHPPMNEQEAICNFLDHETAKIDTLIEKQQQLIKLLKEKRQAVISHAVTKGLNPNVPMKDSGVEWLGEVPAHWEVSNLNYALNTVGDIDHYMPESIDSGIPYVMTGDLKEFVSEINLNACKQVSHDDFVKLSRKIRSTKGDVIMARYATIGTVSYVDVEADFLASYSCVTIKPDTTKVHGLYLYFYFQSDAFLQGIQNQVNTNTQGNVGVGDLKKVKVAIPTLREQSVIIEYIQSRLDKIDRIYERTQNAIELLQERRTALISAAVTGKIDVRDWHPPASADAPALEATP